MLFYDFIILMINILQTIKSLLFLRNFYGKSVFFSLSKRLTSFGVDLEIDSTPMISEEVPRRFIQKITISLLLVSFLLSLTTDKSTFKCFILYSIFVIVFNLS